MKQLLMSTGILLVVGLLLGACSQATVSTSSTPDLTAPASNPNWQQRWDRVLADAKTEGAVNVYTSWKPASMAGISQGFKEKYGINVEYSAFQGASDAIPKIVAETAAGVHTADAYGIGITLLVAKGDNILGPIEPLLVLPEVSDPKMWAGGRLPFADKGTLALSMSGVVLRNLIYNSNLVKEGEITSYKDLLKPQYKGKIVLLDPSIAGASLALVTHLGEDVWNEAETKDFLTRLIKEQGVVISRDYRQNIESVAQAKYAVNIGPDTALLAQFVALGAPVKAAMVQEDNLITAAAGALSVAPKPAHPNATMVFVNWLLGKEGQSIFAKTSGNPSQRLDASLEGVNPIFISDPGKKYFNGDAEEVILLKTKWMGISKNIIAEQMK